MPLDVTGLREEFPLLQRRTYLNNCAYGVLSRRVEAAFHAYLADRHEWGAQWEQWAGRLETVRTLLGRVLQCPAEDISISSSLSESVNSLASSLDWTGPRDTVVVTDFDFPTSSQIWLAQGRRDARIVRARADDSGVHIPLERFDELIDERTLIVSVPWVCYRNGVKTDIGPIIELAHQRGALVFVDAYQAVGSFPLSAPDTGADFLAGGCLKYLLGTAGLAYMYVRGSRGSAQVPTVTGWFAQENPHAMDIYRHQPAPTASRFQAGTPNISALYACAAGIELLLETPAAEVGDQIARLTAQVADGCAERGWKLTTPAEPERHGAMMAIASTDSPALVRAMESENVVASERDGNLRVSAHYYNDDEDISKLFAALDRHAHLVRRAD